MTPDVEDEASELDPLPFFPLRLRVGAEESMATVETFRDKLNKLASFLKGDGLPGRCVAAAAAAAADAGVVKVLVLPGGEVAEASAGKLVVVWLELACCCCCDIELIRRLLAEDLYPTVCETDILRRKEAGALLTAFVKDELDASAV